LNKLEEDNETILKKKIEEVRASTILEITEKKEHVIA
jgi:hypothetical protein